MATLSSIGIGSGIDANSIVSQLVALERKPIEQLKTESDRIDARLSSFGRIQAALDTLRTTSRTLVDATTWSAATITSSDSTAVSATASAGATSGSYAVQVTALAAAQLNATAAVAGPTTTIGQGTLTIDVGRWADNLSGFTPKAGTSSVTITIGPGEDTLEKIRDKINGTAGVPVRASIVNDASGSRLVLQATATGADNGFRVQVNDSDSVNDDASGLSRLAYDPPNNAAVSTRPQAGVNARATVNGLPVESATNTLSGVIDGVTLTLGKITNGTVDLGVARDTAAMRKSVDGFVTAYNDLVRLLRDQTRYDAATKAAGTLQGDRAAVGLLGQLRGVLSGSSTASSAFARASDIGMQVQTDGTIKTTGTKLDAAFGQLSQLQAFFATATGSDATSGLAERMRRLADTVLGTDGTVTARQAGLRKLKASNADRQDALEDRVAQTEKRLRAQYQQLDASMARLTSLQNYVSQQITNWNKG